MKKKIPRHLKQGLHSVPNKTVSVPPVSTLLLFWTVTVKLWRQPFRSPAVTTFPRFLDGLSFCSLQTLTLMSPQNMKSASHLTRNKTKMEKRMVKITRREGETKIMMAN